MPRKPHARLSRTATNNSGTHLPCTRSLAVEFCPEHGRGKRRPDCASFRSKHCPFEFHMVVDSNCIVGPTLWHKSRPWQVRWGGGTVVSYKFIYARGLNWLQQCSKVPFSNLPLNLMSGELVMCTTHFAGKAVYVFRAACPQPYTCFDQSPGFAKHRQVQFTSATGSV